MALCETIDKIPRLVSLKIEGDPYKLAQIISIVLKRITNDRQRTWGRWSKKGKRSTERKLLVDFIAYWLYR